MTRPTSKHTTLISLLLCILLAILLSSCNLPMTSQNPAPQEEPSTALETVTLIMTDTPEPTATSIPEEILRIETIPADLAFMDGRNVKAMTAKVGRDENTRLEVALDNEGGIVAYHLTAENEDRWVVNPLIETGFRWNFGPNENGQIVLHHALEEWNYKPFPIGGIRYVKPDQLPVTFWDESDPVREDEQHPWPSEGTLAIFDGEGDILMYYSKQENAWWFAGYQIELPGNMVFRQSSMSLALSGIRYKQVDENIWPGSDLNDTWQEIRNHIDWLAYTNRTGNFISFENISSRVSNGEVFEYQSWIFDLASNDYKLTTLSNKTKMYFETSIRKRDFGNSYDSLFDGRFHGVGLEYSSGIQANPDGSISIINWRDDQAIARLRPEGRIFLGQGTNPFQSYTIDFLAASDKHQIEGIEEDPRNAKFFNISPLELINRQYHRLCVLHLSNPIPDGVEYELSQFTPIIYPNIDNPHPYQKP